MKPEKNMAKNSIPKTIELLAPAKDATTAIEAIKHGADAVYMGATSHGARASAGNSIDDIRLVAEYAHRFGAKVYVTVNTIIYEDEIKDVERLIRDLYTAGADALIVQDMALLRMDLPPIALHASTQCDIRTPEKARFLAQAGMSQLVVARELSIDETAAIAKAAGVPIEAFVHGALCVSYSGDCQAGFATMGRSANRGQCPQICRHSFNLADGNGNILIRDKHLLSLRDLNRSAHLEAMMNAGVTSFKIEGRLKDVGYVKNVVGAYRRMIDTIIEANPEKYCRSSYGQSHLTFTPDPSRSFNRGFTDYFTAGPSPKSHISSPDTPKWIGQPIGKVVKSNGKKIKARLDVEIANGDGLGYFDSSRNFHGFRANRIEGSTIIAAQPVEIAPGTPLFRNHDRKFTALLSDESATRTIDIKLTLRSTPWGIAIDIDDQHGHHASVASSLSHDKARTPQEAGRREILSRTGDTIFRVSDIDDRLGEIFVPRSLLADLRRQAIEALERATRATYRYDRRRKEDPAATLPETRLTYHDNVANSLAHRFYTDHGATEISPAMEAETKSESSEPRRVMTTRFCLRREYGRCLKTPSGSEWPRELYLQSGPMKFRLDFDCSNCRMHLIHTNPPQ